MYCKFCGKEMDDNAQYCPGCGRNQEWTGVQEVYMDVRRSDRNDESMDTATLILAIIGFIIPLVGIIGAIVQLIGGKTKSAGVIGLVTFIGMMFWFFFWGY